MNKINVNINLTNQKMIFPFNLFKIHIKNIIMKLIIIATNKYEKIN
jgi:hypothetical protein